MAQICVLFIRFPRSQLYSFLSLIVLIHDTNVALVTYQMSVYESKLCPVQVKAGFMKRLAFKEQPVSICLGFFKIQKISRAQSKLYWLRPSVSRLSDCIATSIQQIVNSILQNKEFKTPLNSHTYEATHMVDLLEIRTSVNKMLCFFSQ